MTVTLVTQGVVATKLLERLLAQHSLLRESALSIQDRGGHGGSFSLAQAVLMRREPVVVLINADSDEPAYVEDRRELLESLMPGPPWQWRLILWMPEVEILFFQDERLLLELVRPVRPSARHLRRARETPRQVLFELLASGGADDPLEALLPRLSSLDVSRLWTRVPELRVLEEFLLERLTAPRPTSAP